MQFRASLARIARIARIACVAVLLPAPLRADLVIPPDFEVLRESALQGCQTFALLDVSLGFPYSPPVPVTACVQGLVYYGLNTSSNLFGVTYDFSTTLLGTPPAGTGVSAGMRGFAYDGITGTGQHTMVQIGSLDASTNTYLTSGVFYSPLLYASSPLVSTFALFIGRQNPSLASLGFGDDDRFGPLTVTTVPEPAPVALVGAGLLLVFGARRLRPRREPV